MVRHGRLRISTSSLDAQPTTSIFSPLRCVTSPPNLRVAGLDDDEARQLPVQLDGRSLGQMELSTWRSDAGDFDVLVGIPDRNGRVMPYDELIARAEEQRLHGVVVHTGALDDIVASKQWADRPKDRRALPRAARPPEPPLTDKGQRSARPQSWPGSRRRRWPVRVHHRARRRRRWGPPVSPTFAESRSVHNSCTRLARTGRYRN